MIKKKTALISLLGFALGGGAGMVGLCQGGRTSAGAAASEGKAGDGMASEIRSSRAFEIPENFGSGGLLEMLDKELSGAEPDTIRLEVIFMCWFQRKADLWAEYQELAAKYPRQRQSLSWALHTAWAYFDCDAAFAKVKAEHSDGWAAVWAVACALGHPAAAQPDPFHPAVDFSPAGRLAARDPSKASELMRKALEMCRDPEGFPLAVVKGWLESAPQSALTWLSEPHSGSNLAWLPLAGLMWLRKDPGALTKIPQELRDRMESYAAFNFLAGQEPGKKSSPGTAGGGADIFYFLPRLDPLMGPGDFVRTALAAEPGVSRTRSFFSSRRFTVNFPTWFKTAPNWTLDEILPLEACPAKDGFVQTVLESWNGMDPGGALNYARNHGLPAPKQSPAVPTAPLSLSEIAEAIPNGGDNYERVTTINTSLIKAVKENPEDSLAWIEGHFENSGGNREPWLAAARLAGATLAETDLAAATKGVEQLPPGALRDAAAVGMLSGLWAYDPVAGLEWVQSLAADQRDQNLSHVFNYLERNLGATGASIAIRQSSLPDSVKKKLLPETPQN